MLIVDDRLAYDAVAGSLPAALGHPPVATTYVFHYRLTRALSDDGVIGALSRHADQSAVLERVLSPPADRLIVLEPTRSIGEAVRVAVAHRANLLLAELVGAAIAHGAAVRVTVAGAGWPEVMSAEGVDFAIVDP